jgi:outer membrane receptor protein involved in Fe transport
MAYKVRYNRAKRLWMLGAASCLSTAFMPGLAHADDDAGAGANSAPDAPSGLEEVIVTANRRAESLQKVAVSIQALEPAALEEHQVTSFADYANMLPSVSYATLGPGRTNLYFRGISVAGGSLPTVGVYLDDIPLTSNGRMPDVHVYDVERVEALAGPQGTLFGSSSLAGTMRIITQKPKFDGFKAGYDVQMNKFGKGGFGQMIEGFINEPLNDRVAVRLMAYTKHDAGYIDNTHASYTYQLGDADPTTTYTIDNTKLVKKDFNPNTEYGARLAVGIDLDDGWTMTPSVTYQYLNAQGSYNYDPRFGDLVVHDYSPTYNKDEWVQAALSIQGKIADFDFVSSTGYFKRRIRNANDYTYYSITYDKFGPGYETYLYFKDKAGNTIDPTQQYFGDLGQRKFTQEVRLSVPESWPFNLTLGGFYQTQKNETNNQYYIPGLSKINLATSCGTGCTRNPAVKGDAFYLTETDATYNDYALFTEGTYEILPRLKLTAGIRLFRTDNLSYGFAGVSGSARRAGCTWPFPATARLSCINNNIPFHESGETHRVSLAYQLDADKMAYFTYSTGYRPGGGNRIAPNNPYLADKLSNYEVGIKTSWANILRVNAAIYFEKWKGVQYGVVPYGFQGAGITVNAGDAQVKGLELDAQLKLDGWNFSVSGAYNDAQLATNFCNLDPVTRVTQLTSCTAPAQIAAASGTRLPRQPKIKTQGTIRYEWEGDFKPYVQGTVFYQSSSTSNLDTYLNSLLGNTSGFSSIDLSAGVKRGNWTLEAFMQNAFDKRGELSKNTFCSIQYCHDSSRTYPIKPQFFGVSFSQRF